jgi:hypothetical protein
MAQQQVKAQAQAAEPANLAFQQRITVRNDFSASQHSPVS